MHGEGLGRTNADRSMTTLTKYALIGHHWEIAETG
jgi:hypothetical protein